MINHEQLSLFDMVAHTEPPCPVEKESSLEQENSKQVKKKHSASTKKSNTSKKPKAQLELAVYLLEAEQLRGRTLYGFKISKKFRQLLIGLIDSLDNKTQFKGRQFFKIASVIYPNQLIHMHGGLNIVESNNNVWFYSEEPFDFSELKIKVEDHIYEEFYQFKELMDEIADDDDWGQFIEIDLADLLNYELYKNGFRILEKYFLSYFTKRTFELNEDCLTFQPVLAEGTNYVMSNPLFHTKKTWNKDEETGELLVTKEKDVSPFSYAINCRIEKRTGIDSFCIYFTVNTKAWVQSNVLKHSGKFLSSLLYTSVFLHPKAITGDKISDKYIQIKVKREDDSDTDGVVLSVEPSDAYCLKHYELDLASLLDQEMMKNYSENPTTLTTVNRYALGDYQPIEGSKKGVQAVARGVAPVDRRWFVNMIDEVVSETFRLSPLTTVAQTYDESLVKSTLLDVRSIISLHYEQVVKLGVFVSDPVKEAILEHWSKILIPLEQEGVFKTEDGTQLELIFGSPCLGEWGLMGTKEIFFKEKEREILDFLASNEVAGCLIETERERIGISGLLDSKPFLRDFFAKLNIPTQFIYPKIEDGDEKIYFIPKNKPTLENTVKPAFFDLLSDTGFEDGRARLLYEGCPIKTFLAIGKLNLTNGSVPVLVKTKGFEVEYLVYPETEWKSSDQFHQHFSTQLIQACHTHFKKNNSDTRKAAISKWLPEAISQLTIEKPFCVLWDRRVETLIPYPLNNSRNAWLERLFYSDFKEDAFVRWSATSHAPLAVQTGIYNGEDRVRHIPQYHLSNELPQQYFCYIKRNGNLRFTLDKTKKDAPVNLAAMSGMAQLEIVQECGNGTNHQALLTYLFGLRRAVLSTEDSIAYPKPMRLISKMQKLIDSCELSQQMLKKKKTKK